MPRSKKTHTKYTERAAPRHLRRLKQTRQNVAAEAARIIATEGQHNYHAAKKKAAERIGVSDRLALPSNIEVKDALRTYQELYGGSAHQETIERLRQTAAQAMQLAGWLESGRDTALLIGGPDGLAPACLERADRRWSLSDLTFPHALVRVIVAEQLYRAWTLHQGHPYHRS